MILKRQEKDGLIKAMYDSSNVLASIYNTTNSDLDLIFKSGQKYRYPNVSKSDYMRLEVAESQGEVFNTHIKKYVCEKLEKVDPSKILDEAEDLKSKEEAALHEAKRLEMVKQLKNVYGLNHKMELRSIGARSPEAIEEFDKNLQILNNFINNYLKSKTNEHD